MKAALLLLFLTCYCTGAHHHRYSPNEVDEDSAHTSKKSGNLDLSVEVIPLTLESVDEKPILNKVATSIKGSKAKIARLVSEEIVSQILDNKESIQGETVNAAGEDIETLEGEEWDYNRGDLKPRGFRSSFEEETSSSADVMKKLQNILDPRKATTSKILANILRIRALLNKYARKFCTDSRQRRAIEEEENGCRGIVDYFNSICGGYLACVESQKNGNDEEENTDCWDKFATLYGAHPRKLKCYDRIF